MDSKRSKALLIRAVAFALLGIAIVRFAFPPVSAIGDDFQASQDNTAEGRVAPIATVDGESCTTLEEVLLKLNENVGGTLQMLSDFYLETTLIIPADMDVTFDLNGYTITVKKSGDKSLYAVRNYGTFTVKDTSAAGTGSIRARGTENMPGGTMRVESGTIVAVDTNGGSCIWNEGDLTVTGGTLKTEHVGTASDQYGISCINNDHGKLLITGGTLHDVNARTYALVSTGDYEITPAEGSEVTVFGKHGGISSDAGTGLVNGGYFESEDYYGLYTSTDGTGLDPQQARMTVNGGTFVGKSFSVWVGSDIYNDVYSSIIINGGTFKKPVRIQSKARSGEIRILNGDFLEGIKASNDGLELSDYVDEGSHCINHADGSVNVHVLDIDHVGATTPTCTTAGNSEYWECGVCHQLYLDADATTTTDDVMISALGHNNAIHVPAKDAEPGVPGVREHWKCDRCDKFFADEAMTQPLTEEEITISALPVTYKVTFVDGLSATEDAVVEVDGGDTVAKPADPTNEGWTFVGWYTDAAFTTAYDFTTPVTSDLTLYGGWKKKDFGETTAPDPVKDNTVKRDGDTLPHTGDTIALLVAVVMTVALVSILAGLFLKRSKR